jgi:hypothetical protein
VKLGNKIDSIEVEAEIEKVKKRIEECWQSLGRLNATQRTPEIKTDNLPVKTIPAKIIPPSGPTNDTATRKFIERSLGAFDKKMEKCDDRIHNLES